MYFLAFLLVASAIGLLNGTFVEWTIKVGQIMVDMGIMAPFVVDDTLRNLIGTALIAIEILCVIGYAIYEVVSNSKTAQGYYKK